MIDKMIAENHEGFTKIILENPTIINLLIENSDQ